MSDPTKTYYEILEVNPDDDAKTIRRAYLKASLKHHPDKNPNDVENAKHRFVEIGRAYDVLKDPIERAKYDDELRRSRRRKQPKSTRVYSNEPEPNIDVSFATYDQAFDSFVGNMSEEDLSAAMGMAAMVGGMVGSMLGSRLAKGREGTVATLLANSGSVAGSVFGSQMGANVVKNVHGRSVDRLTYEQRKQEALQRGTAVPERPKGLWEDLTDTLGKTLETLSGAVSSGASSNDNYNYNPNNDAREKSKSSSRRGSTTSRRGSSSTSHPESKSPPPRSRASARAADRSARRSARRLNEEKWGQRLDTAMKVASTLSSLQAGIKKSRR